MKRRLLIVAVFLLAGAVVNVAVAWAAWGKTGYSLLPVGRITFRYPNQPPADRSDRERWARHATDSWPQETDYLQRSDRHSFGVWYRRITKGILFQGFWPKREVARELMLSAGMSEVIMVRIGWPANCLTLHAWRWEPYYAEGPDGWPVQATKTVVHEHDGLLLFGKPMPRHLLWPGFAVNTILYATVLTLLICGPFALRRFIRIRHRLCPACAYPRGASDVCSECSRPLHQHAVA